MKMKLESERNSDEILSVRMSNLIGVPLENVKSVISLISEEDKKKIAFLPDNLFMIEATQIINNAQKKQYSEFTDDVTEFHGKKISKKFLFGLAIGVVAAYGIEFLIKKIK